MKNLILLVFLLGVQINTFSQNEYLLKLHSFNGESPKTAFSEITRELEVSHRYINDSILTFQSPLLITINEMAQLVEMHGYVLKDFQLLAQATDKEFINQNNYQTKACCNITIDMFDSYGDGWNGATLEVIIDGSSTNYAFTNGSTKTVIITYCDGQNLEIIYNSGAWEGENSYTISNNHGIIFGDGPNPTS